MDSNNSSRNSIISNPSETSRHGSEDRSDIDMDDGGDYDVDMTLSQKSSPDSFRRSSGSHKTSFSERLSIPWYEGQQPAGIRRLSIYSEDVNEASNQSADSVHAGHEDVSYVGCDYGDVSTSLASSQLSKLSMDGQHGMEVDDSGGGSSPAIRKQRARSGAVTGSRTFSMGYRADCEKCTSRVPGHISHIIYS